MLDGLQNNIARLISLYESEKARADGLAQQLSESREETSKSNGQILELKRQMENLKLRSAFGGAGADARESIDRLVSEIDRCIRLLEY